MPADSTVSIIVPLAGGPAQALRCLEGIALQPDEPRFEVIVIDDASVGLEALLAQLEGDVTVLRSDRRLGFGGAAWLGLERAGGEIAVLVRDAAQPQPGWLTPLAGALGGRGVGLATSATHGSLTTSPVATWSIAGRTADLLALGAPDLEAPFVAGALALALAQRGLAVVAVPDSVIVPPGARTGAARRPPGETPEVTIVIPTLDAAAERVRRCLSAVQATTDAAHEIVIVDNGSPPQGFSAPVNAGLRAAATPYVVIMNDDVEPLPGWWPPLRDAIDAGASVAFPLTVDGAMRNDFAAWCFALGRRAIAEFSHAPDEFFDPSLVVWYQDTDLLHRLRRAGRPPVLIDGSRIRHGLSETVMSEDPELQGWIQRQVAVDRAMFIRKHPDAVLRGDALEAA